MRKKPNERRDEFVGGFSGVRKLFVGKKTAALWRNKLLVLGGKEERTPGPLDSKKRG